MSDRNHFSYDGVEQEKLGQVIRYGKRHFLLNVWKMDIIGSKMVELLTQNFIYLTITTTHQTKESETNKDSESIRQFRTLEDRLEFLKNGRFTQQNQTKTKRRFDHQMNIRPQRDRVIIVKVISLPVKLTQKL